jgi:hypothetical protein
MRSRILPAAASDTPADDRREPSLARQAAPAVTRLGGDGAPAAKPLRAGERLAVLSSSDAPQEGRAGMGILVKLGLGAVFALALVGAFTLVRFLAGL